MIFSSLRIFATIGIFIFHILGLYEIENHPIDFISIMIFCFLSGYLSTNVNSNPFFWIKKRVFSIMIPYWIVIIPALLLNRLISYKDTSFGADVITFLGGNLFLSVKIYVIAWYITFILMLYGFVFFQSLAKSFLIKAFGWIIGFSIFHFVLNEEWYFISFGIGFFFAIILPPPDKTIARKGKLNNMLFVIQNHCYSFFLLHGGVLLFLSKICELDFLESFILGLILSIFGAVALNKIAKSVLKLAIKNINDKGSHLIRNTT